MLVGRGHLGQRSETVHRANLSAIVRELHRRGPLSRSELVARTGLTRTAIRSLVGELVAAGLAMEDGATLLGTPGRPSSIVRPDPSGAVVLALEIAVDSLAVAVVGLGGEIFGLVRVDRPRGHWSVDDISADLVDLAGRVGGWQTADRNLIGIGVSVVGLVRRRDGLVAVAPNLGWRDVALGERLAAAFATNVPISVGNDADLAALAEARRGVAMGADGVVVVWGEAGVGGGLIADGKQIGGIAGFAGEIGHMPVNPAGSLCGCGSVGCWETEIGEGALLRLAGHSPGGGRVEVDAVLREAAAGSTDALSALNQVGRWLGTGLAGLVNVLNPRLIVLGGMFMQAYPYVIEALEEELGRRALRAPRAMVQVVPSRLGMDGPLLGAAEEAFEPLLSEPAAWLASHGVAQLASA